MNIFKTIPCVAALIATTLSAGGAHEFPIRQGAHHGDAFTLDERDDTTEKSPVAQGRKSSVIRAGAHRKALLRHSSRPAIKRNAGGISTPPPRWEQTLDIQYFHSIPVEDYDT